jgi:hypothetical protein
MRCCIDPLAYSTNMTLLATARDALFVPQDSSLSRVELLTWNVSPHPSHRKARRSHDEHSRTGVQVFGPRLQKNTEGNPEEPEAAVVEDVPSNGSQQDDISLRWVSATSSGDLECHLGVRPDGSLLRVYIFG